jgi:hypothetical protein
MFMKATLLAVAMVFSSSVFARQYIQCNTLDTDSTDVAVVNLETKDGGTLFLSSGMQNPEDERTLVHIKFDKIEKAKHVFKIVENDGFVAVPSSIIGKSSNSVMVDVNFNGYFVEFSCFARIYND